MYRHVCMYVYIYIYIYILCIYVYIYIYIYYVYIYIYVCVFRPRRPVLRLRQLRAHEVADGPHLTISSSQVSTPY